MMLYEICEVIKIDDSEDKGRVVVKYLRTGMTTESYLPLVDSFYSKGDNGWDGELLEGDIIVVSFFDYPENQKPFVFGKVKSKSQTNKREGKETLKIKEHIVVFEDNKVTIQHKNNKSKVVLEDGKISMSSDGTNLYSMVREELLEIWLKSHYHLGNLGYPVATTEASGFPWNDEITSKGLKIT